MSEVVQKPLPQEQPDEFFPGNQSIHESQEQGIVREELSRQLGKVILILREGKNRIISIQGGIKDDRSGFRVGVYHGMSYLGLYEGLADALKNPEQVAQDIVTWAANRQPR